MTQLKFLKQTIFFALVSLICVAAPLSSNAQIVRFETDFGDIDVNLFGNQTPETVANFLFYLNNGDYDDTFFHRSVTDFVLQGGGFNTDFTAIPTAPPVINEPGISNTRGTIALARIGGQPNSGTNQFFFNLSDNNTFLDGVDGGFTVFGEVIGNGLDVLDEINDLQIANAGGAFNELPLLDTAVPPGIEPDELVVFNNISVIPEPSSLGLLLLSASFLAARRRRV